MLQWFRRKKDDQKLAFNAEQEISTMKKLDMADKAKKILDDLFIERRFTSMPVDTERRRA